MCRGFAPRGWERVRIFINNITSALGDELRGNSNTTDSSYRKKTWQMDDTRDLFVLWWPKRTSGATRTLYRLEQVRNYTQHCFEIRIACRTLRNQPMPKKFLRPLARSFPLLGWAHKPLHTILDNQIVRLKTLTRGLKGLFPAPNNIHTDSPAPQLQALRILDWQQ